jgi:hypothetical protein
MNMAQFTDLHRRQLFALSNLVIRAFDYRTFDSHRLASIEDRLALLDGVDPQIAKRDALENANAARSGAGDKPLGFMLDRTGKLVNFNPNHEKDGKFGSGAGGSIKERVKATTAWPRSAPAQEVLSTIAKSHTTKEVVTFAIGSLIAHGFASSHTGGGFWYSEPGLEPDISTTVHNLSAYLQVTSGRAKDMLKQAVEGLKKLRAKADAKSAKDKATAFHAADEEMLPTEEHLQAILDALDKFDAEAEDRKD